MVKFANVFLSEKELLHFMNVLESEIIDLGYRLDQPDLPSAAEKNLSLVYDLRISTLEKCQKAYEVLTGRDYEDW